VTTTLYVPYNAFTMHVDRQVRRYDHGTLRNLVDHAVARWTAHGCDPEVLRSICVRVFGLR
jgi:hypothetical protein